jgi:hypothetical protein
MYTPEPNEVDASKPVGVLLGGSKLFLLFILFMKDYTFKLIGKLFYFSWIVRSFDTLQQGQKRTIGSTDGSGSSFIDQFVGFGTAHLCSLDYIVAALFAFRFVPSCLNRFPGAFATLFGSEFGGSCKPPFFPPIRPRATAAGFFCFTAMFLLYVSGHEFHKRT